MRCEIVSVGTEVVTGDIVNTNAPYIAKELNNLGIQTAFHTAVRDEMDEMVEILDIARKRADLIVTIGGLGPTYDQGGGIQGFRTFSDSLQGGGERHPGLFSEAQPHHDGQ